MATTLRSTLLLLAAFCLPLTYAFQGGEDMDATAILRKSEDKMRGASLYAEIKMTIQRPDWNREMGMKSWSQGNEYSLILITSPVRDKGTAFLKREKEVWNWQPTIDRVIKMPPSMMSQSWMGSDFTNDDLVRESSFIKDYTHKILAHEEVEGRPCWKIELMPKEDAPVVWGKVETWEDKQDFLQLRSKLYDEDGYLINTMEASGIKEMGGKVIASKMKMIPEDKPGHSTAFEYVDISFDKSFDENFFSIQNMKRIR